MLQLQASMGESDGGTHMDGLLIVEMSRWLTLLGMVLACLALPPLPPRFP
jgi:hypothetical protein